MTADSETRPAIQPVDANIARRLEEANRHLTPLDAQARVTWTLEHLPGQPVLASSFGIQAAVMLHLVTRIMPRIPVVFIDTGYLFPETYQFVDQLVDQLDLNLRVYRPDPSPAWLEARHGRLWEQGLPGIERYNHIQKVEPMQRALQELEVGTWFAGLRRAQSSTRQALPLAQYRQGRFKIHPILDWGDRAVYRYLQQHQLPYHPLWQRGYVSVGDWHTSRPLEAGMLPEDTRFFGLKRECGLHE